MNNFTSRRPRSGRRGSRPESTGRSLSPRARRSCGRDSRKAAHDRGRFGTEEGLWIRDVVARFPQMSGRLFTMTVPGGEKATFRYPATMQQLHARVVEILGLPASP